MNRTSTRGHWPTAPSKEPKAEVKSAMAKAAEPKKTLATTAKSKRNFLDHSELSISNDPIPTKRIQGPGRYDAIFDNLNPGQRIVCESGKANALSNSLRTYLKRTGKNGQVTSCERYERDGKGGVWWILEKVKKP